MSDAFLKLLELIIACWARIRCWEVLPIEEIGFIRRFGRPVRDLTPGQWNWKWPLLEIAETAHNQPGVYVLDPQSLRTQDGVDVVLRASVTFRVVDARKFHLEAWGALENLRDLVAGEIGEAVRESTAAQVWGGEMKRLALKRTREYASQWGIKIIRLRCQDAGKCRSLRLWSTNTTADGQG